MYDYAIDGYGRQLSEFQNRGRSIRYRYDKALDESQCYRIGCWINLLRNLKVQATPDVVAIYMIATGQRDLLSEFIRVPDRSYEPRSYDYVKDGSVGVPCCDCCEYLGSELINAKSKFHAPAEAYKMARKYLDSRVEEFVKILTGTINAEARSIKPGQTVHPFIWNAVMNTSVDSSMNMELGSRMNIVKSLHAMLMPECTSQYSGSYCTESQYQMLGYEPEKYGINRVPHKVVITKEFCSRVSAIASFCEWSLEYFFNKVRKDVGASEFAEVKELICLISEAVLFISQSAHGRSPRWFSHLPKIREINRLLWKDELESSGAGKDCCGDMSCQNAENLMRLRNITPAGALCLGELLCTVPEFRCGDLNAYNCGYMTDYEIQMIESLLPRVSYTDTLNFMICESNWTTRTASQVGQILDYQRREQANVPENRGCCCERS